jgi:hypothetical protein
MPAPPSEPLEQLIRAFFAEAEAAFRALVEPPGGGWSHRLIGLSGGELEETTPDRVEGVFLASCDFRTPQIAGEITFGDRELFINTVVGPDGAPHRYGLWEWADAMGRPRLVPRNTDWVIRSDRVRTIVREMAEATAALAADIARADPDVVARIEAARARVQAESDANWREAEHQSRARRADEAFHRSDWRMVVELLASVEAMLTPAEAAKLAYARRKVPGRLVEG